jgi:EAL domain-containing protein (putative c-di-GMP-specific phosphodiesterase class I)
MAADGSLAAVEALARWLLPDGSIVQPDKFIPIAERTKFIHEMGYLILDEACEALERLTKCGYEGVKINLNMSVVQLQSDTVHDVFRERVSLYDISPSQLVIEITESTLQNGKARETILKLKQIGMGISIDDFGTGFSSISELAEDSYDAIKIDRSLLPDFPLQDKTGKRRALIIENVVNMCKCLNMPCTLEGLETKEQVEYARQIGVNSMQGYFFSRPVDLANLVEYLQASHAGFSIGYNNLCK